MSRDQISYRDLREWLERAEEMGELLRLEGADWDLELGAVTWVSGERETGPALLFDRVKGYPPGYRLLANATHSPNLVALSLGLPLGLPAREYPRLWYDRYSSLEPVPAVFVDDGPVMENVQRGDDVNLFKFPVPRWYEKDGGRYIGTNSATITRDPEDGWVNVGTYRTMVHDERHVSFYIDPGRHGYIHREKYLARGEPCPVAISLGHDPLLFLLASTPLPSGVCELDYAGAIKGQPLEVIKGPITGLPIPACAEVVLEGLALPGLLKREGPFGEWSGYYASGVRDEPVIEVKAVYHRNDPILVGTAPVRAPGQPQLRYGFMRGALLLDALRAAGVPDVVGVASHPVAGASQLVVISIKQRYPGHARQAGLVAIASRATNPEGRYVIVVDEDINIHDLGEVMWAVCTRSDPVRDIEIISRCWSGPLDPIIPTEEKGFGSRAIIDACKPWEWRDRFPDAVRLSSERRRQTIERWGRILDVKNDDRRR